MCFTKLYILLNYCIIYNLMDTRKKIILANVWSIRKLLAFKVSDELEHTFTHMHTVTVDI